MNGTRRRRSYLAAAAAARSLALVLTACSGGDDEGGSDADASSDVDCAAFEQYGDLSGKSISVYTSSTASTPSRVQQTDLVQAPSPARARPSSTRARACAQAA